MRNRTYYLLKPFLPWRLRMTIRRWHARKIRRQAVHWPVLESAGRLPPGWPGWPNGHGFAFVATHDVEGLVGLSRVKRLAELELSLGFRSVFNFIPEGPYAVPPALREWLVANGFEVGVHDLKHDGGLYVTRSGFRRRAERINHYLSEWGAVGFRSGFMLHNLEWLHDLNVQYDASTFDSDPFEPQPDGTGTIFPFVVNNGSDLRHRNVDSPAASVPGPRPNYVELPYTLPQDSTLFLLLQERDASIWLKKLAWIAQRGGMALVNVHPDYLRFPDEPEDDRTFPVGHYVDLLQAIQKQRERVWCPLPHQLAAWCHETGCRPAAETTSPAPSTSVANKDGTDSLLGRRIAVLLYSSYPSDSRPRRAAEAMVQAGARVELICPKETSKALAREEIGGVEVTRVPLILRRGGKLTYFYQYGMFFLACGLVLTRRTFRRKYDAIHAHNMPDFLVWAAWLPRLLGAKIILDLHDPMPELFMSLYHRDRQDRMIRCLSWLEQRCVAFAHLVLTPNEAFRQRFVSRSGCVGKIQVIMNSPEEQIFSPGPAESTAAPRSGGFRVMHHGLIAERHGLDIAIEAISLLRSSIPDLTFEIFGERKDYLDRILELARERGVGDRVHFHGMVSEQEIARQIHQSDLGIIPNRWSPFIEINLPTRIFEYLALHRPVIVPFTSGIRDYFGADDILYFQPNSATDLARQILWVRQNPAISQEIANRGYSVYQQHLWRNERLKFLTLVARLFQPVTAEENVLNALTLP